MSELTLNEKFKKVTGINIFDVEAYIQNAIESGKDMMKTYREIQWKIPEGMIRDPKLLRNNSNDSLEVKKAKLYAELITDLAKACGVSSSKDDVENIDINGNNSTTDREDKMAQETISEAYAILDYDDEDEDEGSSEDSSN